MNGSDRKGRAPSTVREVLYGFHPVMEAMAAGRRTIHDLVVDRKAVSERQRRAVAQATGQGIPVRMLSPTDLRQICGSDQHQGVAMTVSPLPLEPLAPMIARTCTGPDAGGCLLMLLDSIVDPNNLGAIVRSAHCAGAHALVIPKDRAAGATPAVSKASAGALEHMAICQVTNLRTTIDWLKKQGIWVAGLAMAADRSVFQADLRGPLALVVGGEEKGLRPLIRQQCDFLISIPLCGRVDSLNASAAAAVVLYEAYRQRRWKD